MSPTTATKMSNKKSITLGTNIKININVNNTNNNKINTTTIEHKERIDVEKKLNEMES